MSRCQHLRTRCIHGDEVWARMKVYLFRFWKQDVIRRQSCLDCGRALDRDPICLDNPQQHTWEDNALDLQADLPDADWIAFDLDDGDTVTINAAHIVRIDFDDTPKPSWWRRLFAKEGDE